MKKGIVILIPLALAITVTMMMAPQVKAADVIIHDDETLNLIKPTEECSELIYAEDGVLTGHYYDNLGDGNGVWLRGLPYGTPTGAVTVQSMAPYSVIYVQFRSSDDNDGIADIYVDDLINPIIRIDSYNRGDWYVEIKDLPNATHTVRVKASDNSDFSDVIVSPHHQTPDIMHTGDLWVWYFCFSTDRVPSLTQWGLIILLVILAGIATWVVLKRRRIVTA
jgi:hypothetical protein